jgi:ribosomal-protein-alanine N-acetyltransferase
MQELNNHFNKHPDIGFRITPAKLSDSTTIAGMSRDLIEYGLPWSWRPARIAWQIGNHGILTKVARANVAASGDGPLIGFALARFYDGYARLMLLAVSPEWQKRAIGRELVDSVHNICIANGCPTLHLEARISNKGGLAFYRRLGFSPLVDIPHYYANGEDARHLYRHIELDK